MQCEVYVHNSKSIAHTFWGMIIGIMNCFRIFLGLIKDMTLENIDKYWKINTELILLVNKIFKIVFRSFGHFNHCYKSYKSYMFHAKLQDRAIQFEACRNLFTF